MTQGNVLGPLLFLAYVNDIWRSLESTIKLFANDCIIYRKIMNDNDISTLQIGAVDGGEGNENKSRLQ